MTNDRESLIVISKDCIEFDGEKLAPPFKLDEVKNILGEGRYLLANPEYNVQYQVWDNLGIFGWLNKECTEITAWAVCINLYESNPVSNLYEGKILIGKKNYLESNWKYNGRDTQEMKQGCFNLCTLLPDMISQAEDTKIAALSSSRIEIDYIAPKVKKAKKYVVQKLNEPILEFTNYNFKLAVIQQLMYEKELLTPKFDIYEFAEEYTRRDIDIDDEGYEPIKEAKKWFKDLQIPKRLAEEVTELEMDGGDDIYLQID